MVGPVARSAALAGSTVAVDLDCLRPVIRAVKAVGGDEAAKWAFEMQIADRVGFICDDELAELRDGS